MDSGLVLNSAQVWTVIGGFFVMIAVLVTLMLALVAGLRSSLDDVRSSINDKVDGLSALVNARLDHLDRDVQALTIRVFRNNE